MALAPVVGNCVGENSTVPVECRGRDGPADRRIALETVLGILVPREWMSMMLREIHSSGGTYQKWKVPSEPAVEKVPKVGWKEMAFTL